MLKRVLEIPRERVTALIKHTDKNVPALARKKWAQLIETNPIAAWVDDCIVLNPDAKGYIGKDDPEQIGRWLYANFCEYQRGSGHRGIPPVKRFSANLRDLLKNQMKVSVTEGRDRFGAYIQGVGLRCFHDPNHTTYKRPITKENCDNIFEECDGFEEKCDGFVTDETLTSVGCDGCDGFLEVCESSGKNDDFSVMEQDGFSVTEQIALDSPVGEIDEIDENSRLLLECGENPSHPSHPSLPRLPAVTNPSQVEANPSQVEQVEQSVANSTEISESAAQCDLPLYQRADGQIEVDQLVIGSAAPEDDLNEWLKPKAVNYCKGDKVAKRVDQEQVGVFERFDADFGECLVHFEFSSDWLNPADLIPVEVKA